MKREHPCAHQICHRPWRWGSGKLWGYLGYLCLYQITTLSVLYILNTTAAKTEKRMVSPMGSAGRRPVEPYDDSRDSVAFIEMVDTESHLDHMLVVLYCPYDISHVDSEGGPPGRSLHKDAAKRGNHRGQPTQRVKVEEAQHFSASQNVSCTFFSISSVRGSLTYGLMTDKNSPNFTSWLSCLTD